jgi:hypothetical protein
MHGSCQVVHGNAKCECELGYHGPQCEVQGAMTAKLPEESYDKYASAPQATCPAGYDGDDCKHNIDDCPAKGCKHGTCVDGLNAATCDCSGSGYKGDKCEIDVDECATNNGNCGDPNVMKCENKVGAPAATCTALNDCAVDNGGCGSMQCNSNPSGGHTCGCQEPAVEEAAGESICGNITTVSVGVMHTCAISEHGALFCWGANDHGQLGDNSTSAHPKPKRVGSALNWQSVSVGDQRSCAIQGGALFCWGLNANGELGTGNTSELHVPTQVGTATNWSHISLGSYHSCGLRAGELDCWGQNKYGQIGTGDFANSTIPKQVGTDDKWTMVSAGYMTTCGIKAGQLWCWGYNQSGVVGDGTLENKPSPVMDGANDDWTQIAVGQTNACGVRDGLLNCWGNVNISGHASPVLLPTPMSGDNDYKGLTVGISYQCGLRADGMYCWRWFDKDPKAPDANMDIPTKRFTGTTTMDWSKPSAQNTMCALHGPSLECWGPNWNGQLGDGTMIDNMSPAPPDFK